MKKVCHEIILVPMPKVKVTGQRSKSCLSNISKTTEANFAKYHGKIEHILANNKDRHKILLKFDFELN